MNLADVPREKLSPMMQQYAATKEKYSDCIVFFRLGDFGRTGSHVRRTVSQCRTLFETSGG